MSSPRIVAAVFALAVSSAVAQSPVPSDERLLRAEVAKLESAYRRPGSDRQDILRRLAEALRDSGDPALVARGLRIAVDLNPKDHVARRELAELAVEAKRENVAIRLFQKVIQARPGDLEARLGIAYAYDALDRHDEALANYEEVVRRDPARIEALIGSASIFQTKNQPEKALRRAQAALAQDPANAEAKKLSREAAAEIADGRVDGTDAREPTPAERVAQLRTRLVAAPGNIDLRKLLGAALLNAGWAGEARLEFLQLLKEGVNDTETLRGLARAHRESGDVTGGRVYAERALLMKPTDLENLLEMARVFDSVGNVGLVRKTYEKALQYHPSSPRLYLDWGLFEFSQKRLGRAEELLAKGSAEDPDDATLLAARARVLLAMRREDEAETLLKRARVLDPRDSEAWRALAEVRQEARMWRDAIQAWQEFLFLSPFDPVAWSSMASALVSVDEHADALKALDVALALDDEDPAILDAVEAALARLPHRPDSAALRILVLERRAYILRRDGDLDGAVRMLEGVAEERARQIRAVQANLEDPSTPPNPAARRARLRSMLGLTRAKVRAHQGLALLYLDLERDELVERQYHELHVLDPDSAETMKKLAALYYERSDHRRSIAWTKRLPKDTRFTAQEKLNYAESLDATGREQQAERVLKDIERTEPPSDEVQRELGNHLSRKGNNWASFSRARRAISLYGGNQQSLENVRSLHKSETPDYWAEYFTFNDRDGISVDQYLLGGRVQLDQKTDVAATVSRFRSDDRFVVPVEDTGFQLMLRHEASERFRFSAVLGLVRFSTDGGIAWDVRTDWNPDDRFHVWLRLFQDSVNETPLASTMGFENTGFELDGTWYASHRARVNVRLEEASITGGNHRSSRNLDLALRPLGPVLPGWLHLARGNLSFDKQVAPALYFSPDDLDQTDYYYEVSTELGELALISAIYGLHDDKNFGLTHRLELSAQFDRGPGGNVTVDYRNIRRDRSYHNFARDYRSDELTVQFNGQF